MNLKSKVILLAVAPLLAATTLITYLGLSHARSLTSQELAVYEHNLVESKKQALKDQVAIAMSAIRPTLTNPNLSDDEAQTQVKAILTHLTYGEDGYFFAYDQDGTNLVHPTQPDFVGQNLYEFQDRSGNYLIQHLLQAANSGGGFHRYIWEKPPLMQQEDKLSYVVLIDRWQWMMGTGLYLDDIYVELDKARDSFNKNIRNSLFTVLFVVGITVILVILLGLAINLHEHKLADNRLKELVQRFMRFQVSERRKFSRELHDGINQLLVSGKFRVELVSNKLQKGLPSEQVIPDLKQAESVIDQTIQEVRQLSHNLRPTLLDDLGLQAALQALTDQFSERTNIEVALRFRLSPDKLPDEIEISLYRLAQECLTNIEKHAQAHSVHLAFWQQNNRIEFECLDDGKGFNIKSKCQGIGLLNMRERLELVGGEFSLQSQAGRGTRIRATLPVSQSLTHRG